MDCEYAYMKIISIMVIFINFFNSHMTRNNIFSSFGKKNEENIGLICLYSIINKN